MKKKFLFFILVIISVYGKIFADYTNTSNPGTHDTQQITSKELHDYVTGKTGKGKQEGGGGGNGQNDDGGGGDEDREEGGGDRDDEGGGDAGAAARYESYQRRYAELQNKLASIKSNKNSKESTAQIEAELKDAYADIQKATRELAAANKRNQSAQKDSAAEKNTAELGDPVKASVGVYCLEENDISTRLLTIKRKYESDDTIVSGLGRGWVFSLDQRIIYGIDAFSEKKYEALIQEKEKLRQKESEYTVIVLSDFEITSLETGVEEINARIEECNSIENSINELAAESGSYLNIEELRNEVNVKKTELENDLILFNEALQSIENLKAEVVRIQQEAEEYNSTVIKINNERKNRNKMVMLVGSPSYYEETGLDTLTFIDEDGYPHILYETSENSGVWKNEEDKSISECRKNGEGLLLVESSGITKIFDDTGFLVKITDRNGNYIEIKRAVDGKIKTVETSFGEKYRFEYAGNFIRKITNERSPDETVLYSYEGNYLTSVKDTDGDTVSMNYDSNGRMISLNKCDGSLVQFVYGEQTADGKILTTSTVNEEGFSESFEYDRSGMRTDYIDHDGNRSTYWYDEKHRTIRELRPDGSDIRNEYDEKGNLVSVNENGNVTGYSYDSQGNKTSALYSDGSRETWTYDNHGLVTSWTDRDGVFEEYIRDSKGNLTDFKKGGKSVYSCEYDSKGQNIKKTIYGQNPIVTDYEYDTYGNLIKEVTGGISEEYEYDSRNRIRKIKSSGKLIAEYEYSGNKTVQKNYNGLETTYVTNGRKDLVEVIQKDIVTGEIHKTRVEYDRRHLPVKIFAGNGQTEKLITSYSYSPEGKLKLEIQHGQEDSGENWIRQYEYKNGRVSEIRQAKSSSEEVWIQKIDYRLQNGNRSLVTVTDPLGIKNLFEYDSYGNLIKTTDGNGEVNQRNYTKQGKLSGEQTTYGGWYQYTYKDGLIASAGEKNERPVTVECYPDGSIKAQTDRYGIVIRYYYDERGRVSSLQSENRKVFYEYDSLDRITKEVIGNSPDESSSLYYVTYEYSDDGRTVTVAEGGKYKTENQLDAFGNVIKQIDGNNNERSFVYNERNQLTEAYDGYGNKTSYEYNALGKVSRIIQADGAESNYQYNHLGLLENISDNCGLIYEAAYDSAGRLIKERNRADSEKAYEYDNGGRVTKILCGGVVVESYTYSSHGRTLTVKDGKGNDYLYKYDGFRRLTSERNRNGLVQTYSYNAEGELQSQTDFAGASSTIVYSSDRRGRTVRYSDGSENRFVYDAFGNLLEAQNQYGKTLYRYDQGGRLVYQKDVMTGEEVYFDYDAAGNRTRLFSSNRETTYTYGSNNEVKEIFDNKQRLSIKLKYDKIGREILRKFGNGTAEYTLYDKAGRVIVKMQKSESGELLWGEGYVYGADGKRNATVDNSGCVTLYEYDRQGSLSSVYYPYTDDMVSALKSEAEENGLSCLNDAGENKYLPSEIRNQIIPLLNSMQAGLAYGLPNLHIFMKESYAYDKNGNRISKITPYGTIEYSYDKENCLVASGSKGQAFVNYSYDKTGNLLTEESACKTVKYAYNSQNRLIYCEVTDKDVKEYAQTTYAYDAFGRRILVQDKGEAALRTLYDGLTFDVIKQSPTLANGMYTDSYENGIRWGNTGRPTGDRYRYLGDEDAKDNNRYFYLDENTWKTVNNRYRGERTSISVNGTIAAQTKADYGAEYFTTDLLGSVRTTSDTYGTAKSTYSYDAFGALVQNDRKDTTDYGYLGKPYDPTAKLYNYGYRDYNPTAARFTTSDPIRDGHNWFAYCNNDPINFIDLWGLFSAEREKAIKEHLDETYVKDKNDCDVWLQKVEKEAYPSSPLKENWGDASITNAGGHHNKLKSKLTTRMNEPGDYVAIQSVQTKKDEKGNKIGAFNPVHVLYASLNVDGSVDLAQCTKNPEGGKKDGKGYSEMVHYKDQDSFLNDGWSKLEFYKLKNK